MPDSETISSAVAFTSYHPRQAQNNGLLAEFSGPLSTVLRAIRPATMELPDNQTHFGFVQGGQLEVQSHFAGVDLGIASGFYFSIPGSAHLFADHPNTTGIIVSARDHTGFLMMGFLEVMGRLRYIDGCTDSLLIPPIRKGDPCLNLLYFPPHTDQTMHTHPSDRIGMILSGQGDCLTEDKRDSRTIGLGPGLLFRIHAGGRHKFRTGEKPMRVLAYHPDSDFGPTDEVHPMINRTMIDGVSASDRTDLHTVQL